VACQPFRWHANQAVCGVLSVVFPTRKANQMNNNNNKKTFKNVK